MAKFNWKVVSKDKKRVTIENDNGKQKTLLTPTGKVAKFKAEIANNARITNDGKRKKTKDGVAMELSKAQKAYRKGYIQALGEQAGIYKKKQK